ncbi:GLPGLI family protein [Chryseobacterium sp.]|uniref:GLPGLI family protein n=1 Tax=Chryseobacterium sp. TaxID=1871047 RepID=UPI0025B9872A|nr:GLPGLI family protein [Chryseobacterium sp.]MBV8325018.1 GLPGLI family protein [Chryseobacterium sp.]
MGKIIFKIIYTVLFIAYAHFYHAQNIHVFYELKYRSASNDTTVRKEDMLLTIDAKSQKSIFQSRGKTVNDSIYRAINSEPNPSSSFISNLEQKLIPYSFYGKIIKNPAENSYLSIESVMRNLYKVPYQFNTTWTLLPGTKKILKYECKNASIEFAGRKWIAWYSSEIPLTDGPYKFRGLPGLILEISSVDGDYTYTLRGLQKSAPSSNLILPKAIAVNTKELMKLKENTAKDPAASFRQSMAGFNKEKMGISISYNGGLPRTDNEAAEAINQEIWNWLKSHDNPIEKGDIWLK